MSLIVAVYKLTLYNNSVYIRFAKLQTGKLANLQSGITTVFPSEEMVALESSPRFGNGELKADVLAGGCTYDVS